LRYDGRSIYIEDFFLINPNKIDADLKPDVVIVGKEVVSLESVKKTLTDILADIRPDYIVVETPFQHQFPQAFRVLSIWVSTLAMVSYLTLKKRIHGLSPAQARSLVGLPNNKEEGQTMIRDLQTFIDLPVIWEKDKSLLVSHTMDAIVVALAMLVIIEKNIAV